MTLCSKKIPLQSVVHGTVDVVLFAFIKPQDRLILHVKKFKNKLKQLFFAEVLM